MDLAGDEPALEGGLEAHFEENRASLQAVEEALAADVDNSKLIMHAMLAEAGNKSWDGRQCALIVFNADGKRVDVSEDYLAVSECALMSEASDNEDSVDEEEADQECGSI